MTKRVSTKSKRRLLIFGTLSLALFVVFISSTISFINKTNELNKQKDALDQNLKQIEELQNELKIEIEKLKDPEYIVRYANEKYYFTTADGQIVFKFQDNKVEPDTPSEGTNNYEKYLIPIIICGLLIVVAIIIKVVRRKKKES